MERQITVAIPGRFDPPHNGHNQVFEEVAQDPRVEEVVIPVCGPEKRGTDRDPMYYEEIEQSILLNTAHLPKPIHVFRADDIENGQQWANYMYEKSPIKFDAVKTGNPYTERLFLAAGFKVEPITLEYPISATRIRDLMVWDVFEYEKRWHRYVPDGTRAVAEAVELDKRLVTIRTHYPRPIVTSSLILPVGDWEHVALVKRGIPPYKGRWANSGGHREPYEKLKTTALREAHEEIIDPKLFILDPGEVYRLGVYDTPYRDPRGDYIDHVYFTEPVPEDCLRPYDDVEDFRVFSIYDLPEDDEIAFDHGEQLRDFIKKTACYRGTNI